MADPDRSSNRLNVEEATFRKFIDRIGKTVEIENLPDGLPVLTRGWKMLHTDIQLALEKQFKKEYMLVGSKEKAAEVIRSEGDIKQVRISTIYFPYRVLNRSVMEAKFKNEQDKEPLMIEYGNKFVPFDRDDFHLLGMQIFSNRALLGPCRVIDLSHLYREDFGEVLGKANPERTKAVLDALNVPSRNEEEKETPDTDAQGNRLTQHQKDLFDKGSDGESINLQLAKPSEAERTVKKIGKLKNRAHAVRATLLSIQRAKAALKNTKDPEKKKNLKKSLGKFVAYKRKIIDKT